MTAHHYEVIEMPGDRWRIVERNGNGEKILKQMFRSRALADARVAKLYVTQARINAVALVRKRAAERCECRGECGRDHLDVHSPPRGPATARRPEPRTDRCCHGSGMFLSGGTEVVLSVVALDHQNENATVDNLRAYCQLCRQHHDADELGIDPLFDIDDYTRS